MVKVHPQNESNKFTFKGYYSVQSRRKEILSEISGFWLSEQGALSSNKINSTVRNSNLWAGQQLVNLKAAEVTYRSGLFHTDPDILIKEQFFKPEKGSKDMSCDIIDVPKSTTLWFKRLEYVRKIFPIQYEDLVEKITPLKSTIINEYYCHEAGHCLGRDVRTKYSQGYFRVKGRAAWPLIFVEEFRADLHSFGFASKNLPEHLAVAVFLYNILVRLSVEAESKQEKVDGYGGVPYLLFNFLIESDVISVNLKENSLVFTNLTTSFLLNVMLNADKYAEEEITKHELKSGLLDTQILAAKYYNFCLQKELAIKKFNLIFNNIK